MFATENVVDPRINGRGQSAPPIANIPVTEDIEHCLAELKSPERIAKNIPVADESIDGKHLFAIQDCLYIFGRKDFSLKKWQAGKLKCISRQDNPFVENHSGRWAFVNGCIGQVFACKTNRPPLQKSWGLPVIC